MFGEKDTASFARQEGSRGNDLRARHPVDDEDADDSGEQADECPASCRETLAPCDDVADVGAADCCPTDENNCDRPDEIGGEGIRREPCV